MASKRNTAKKKKPAKRRTRRRDPSTGKFKRRAAKAGVIGAAVAVPAGLAYGAYRLAMRKGQEIWDGAGRFVDDVADSAAHAVNTPKRKAQELQQALTNARKGGERVSKGRAELAKRLASSGDVAGAMKQLAIGKREAAAAGKAAQDPASILADAMTGWAPRYGKKRRRLTIGQAKGLFRRETKR